MQIVIDNTYTTDIHVCPNCGCLYIWNGFSDNEHPTCPACKFDGYSLEITEIKNDC